MIIISLFSTLFIVHWLADWLLQPQSWALNKLEDNVALFKHSLMYAIFITLSTYFYTTNILFIILTFIFNLITHILLDNKEFVVWWIKNIKGGSNPPDWLVIGCDQAFHFIVLYLNALAWYLI
mgnify:CR=1 FL=1